MNAYFLKTEGKLNDKKKISYFSDDRLRKTKKGKLLQQYKRALIHFPISFLHAYDPSVNRENIMVDSFDLAVLTCLTSTRHH